jgi:hypothetical protein
VFSPSASHSITTGRQDQEKQMIQDFLSVSLPRAALPLLCPLLPEEQPTPRVARRLHYEDCEPGRRIVHEVHGPGVIVCRSAQLVVIRPDRDGVDTLAFPAQLHAESFGYH